MRAEENYIALSERGSPATSSHHVEAGFLIEIHLNLIEILINLFTEILFNQKLIGVYPRIA